ncbi:DUF2238 domain-containing protein [Priestia koreensis]|uniref:DUF2238 domain-containing protein n=1 Tax=Priestia koreensis TaxID=284581 RepID=UPI00203A8D98|nr:DUF2238 domain-containing protein [Priestia koreensis]MCM3003298.1 DUF2238 domain-containing protein [Priestia koreensis]
MNRKKELFLLILYATALIWSAISPVDRFTWWLEVTPALIALLLLLITYDRFQFTTLAYVLIFIHCVILFVGGHYTYARMPLFTSLKDVMDLDRNYYDRLGHIAQGFIPAIIIREILWRNSPLKGSRWLSFIVVSICLAISAMYELIEFGVALMTGKAAEAFLGTQGDVWDTQWDMLFALIGAIVSLILLSYVHTKQLNKKTRYRWF